MHKNKTPSFIGDREAIENLLQVEHQNMVDWLHDELGQNLVAIKSFAAAIMEQSKGRDDDTAELAEFIKQAADQSYRSTYDLMQELRAEEHAELSVDKALETCLEEARLNQLGIAFNLDIDISPDDMLDRYT
ncbi:MAG: histidine kinase, partial [Gammaproteobacteria bacterium]|nr:histidine kinase [Gammaproteobacteria bacterium]